MSLRPTWARVIPCLKERLRKRGKERNTGRQKDGGKERGRKEGERGRGGRKFFSFKPKPRSINQVLDVLC